jgi:hypothetical protein
MLETPVDTSPTAELLERVREQYDALPNLRLTPAQFQRLFGLEPVLCRRVLEALVDNGILSRTGDGHFVRFRPAQ